jgi:hypothetical protein
VIGANTQRQIITAEQSGGWALLDTRTGRYWQLNATAYVVYCCLAEGLSVEASIDEFMRLCEVDHGTAASDVARVANELRVAGLIGRR